MKGWLGGEWIMVYPFICVHLRFRHLAHEKSLEVLSVGIGMG
jgi:hypothetical protein